MLRAAVPLRDHQMEDTRWLLSVGGRGLIASDPGTGKTAIPIVAAVNRPVMLPCVVVCPASVQTHWSREVVQFGRSILGGRTPTTSRVRDRSTPIKATDFVITSWGLLVDRIDELRARGFSTVVADEFHYALHEEANRTRALHALASGCRFRIALTGTPIVNDAKELDAVRAFLGTGGAGPIPMVRRFIDAVLPDLPPKTRAHIPVRLSPRARATYAAAETDFTSWLADQMAAQAARGVSAANAAVSLAAEALVRMGYLRRILAAGKAAATADWIVRAVRAGEPVVCFAEHQEVLDGIQWRLRRHHIHLVRLDGSTSAKERQRAIDRFQAGEVAVFLGSKAAKEGITLTAARHLIFAERYLTAAEEEQAEGRIRRIGQKHATTFWFPHVAGSIDDRLAQIIADKRTIVRRAIGSIQVQNAETEAVAALLETWGAPAEGIAVGPDAAPTEFRTAPSRSTAALVLARARWPRAAAAEQWVRAIGYRPRGVVRHKDGWWVWIVPRERFTGGSFRRMALSPRVSAIVGVRKSVGGPK